MALRDAVKTKAGARTFAEGLNDFLHGSGDKEEKFKRWCEAIAALPRRQTRVLRPRDMIDIQSFIWVQGSEEYPE